MSDFGTHRDSTSGFAANQLQPEDTLDGRLGDDVLDEVASPPDAPSPALAGAALTGDQDHETLDQRIGQELPDLDNPADPRRPDVEELLADPSIPAELDALEPAEAGDGVDLAVVDEDPLDPEELDVAAAEQAAADAADAEGTR